MQYEYEAEIRVEITEDDFVTNFGREPKDEAEWNAYCGIYFRTDTKST